MSGQYLGGRIFGLDVMRATAGLMVTLSHTSYLVEAHWPRFPAVPSLDWVGVFFVLSGFLIGGILLDASAKSGPASLRFIDFMQRRWLRTLPNYYLFLLLNIVLVFIGAAPGMLSTATPAYVVFMQNLHLPLDLFFWESWSLAVEEWFYLLFPLLVFVAIGLIGMSGRRAFVVAGVLFITLPVIARMSVAHHVVDQSTWDIWVNKLVIARLDAPGYGMLGAWLSRSWPKGWQRMRWPAMVLGIALLAVVTTNGYGTSPRFAIYGLNSLEAFSVALLLPLLSAWRKGGAFGGPLRYLSLITYALYLVHLPLLYLFGDLVPHPVAWVCAAHYVLFLAVAIILSTLIYHFWERPFMHLRNPLGHWLATRWARSASKR
ncbi:MAG: acyltransferase [Flavobacteriales bacterium]|nr:acyltransferase [Flavobacteriales bacterium]